MNLWAFDHKGIRWQIGDPLCEGNRVTVTVTYPANTKPAPCDCTELYPTAQVDALVVASTNDRWFEYKEVVFVKTVDGLLTETWCYERPPRP